MVDSGGPTIGVRLLWALQHSRSAYFDFFFAVFLAACFGVALFFFALLAGLAGLAATFFLPPKIRSQFSENSGEAPDRTIGPPTLSTPWLKRAVRD